MKFRLISRNEFKTKITWTYESPNMLYSSLYAIKERYTQEEIALIDNLFVSLDQTNLIMIKKIIEKPCIGYVIAK